MTTGTPRSGSRVGRLVLLVALIVAGGVGAFILSQGGTGPAQPGSTPTVTPQAGTATPGSPSAGTATSSAQPERTPEPTVTPGAATPLAGLAYHVELPDDPDLTRLSIGGSDIWIAGSGDELRGVFIGTIDFDGVAPTIDEAATRLSEELSAIPGASEARPPETLEVSAGPAARVVLDVGTSRFVGYVLLIDGDAWRLVIVNYPDEVGLAVANSFAVPST